MINLLFIVRNNNNNISFVNIQKKCINNNIIESNNKIIDKNDFSRLTLYEENNINVKSFKQENR